MHDPFAEAEFLKMASVFKARPLQLEFERIQVGGPVSGCNSGS